MRKQNKKAVRKQTGYERYMGEQDHPTLTKLMVGFAKTLEKAGFKLYDVHPRAPKTYCVAASGHSEKNPRKVIDDFELVVQIISKRRLKPFS